VADFTGRMLFLSTNQQQYYYQQNKNIEKNIYTAAALPDSEHTAHYYIPLL